MGRTGTNTPLRHHFYQHKYTHPLTYRFLLSFSCHHPTDIDTLQEIRNPFLVKINSAHPHRIATYNERGIETTGSSIVLILTEFCPGGLLLENLKLASALSAGSPITVSSGKRSKQPLVERDGFNKGLVSLTTRNMEIRSISRVDRENPGQSKRGYTGGGGNGATRTQGRRGGTKELASHPLPAERLETWFRQACLKCPSQHDFSRSAMGVLAMFCLLREIFIVSVPPYTTATTPFLPRYFRLR